LQFNPLKEGIMNLAAYRKGLIAVLAAVVTIAQVAGWPLADDLSDQAVAVFDAIAAALVIIVPNAVD
jgi:hypothetical protein